MKLLVFAHTPPPHHGQSYMVKLMLDGFGGDHRAGSRSSTSPYGIECYHINARLSKHLEDIGDVRFAKIGLLILYCLQAIWCRFRHGVENFYYVPAPGKTSALVRDWLVMMLCRPFFKRTILHWHAAGMAKWLETAQTSLIRDLTFRSLGRPDLCIVLSRFNYGDAEKLWPRRIRVVGNGIPDPCPDFERSVQPKRLARLAVRQELANGRRAPESELARAGDKPTEFRVLFLGHCIREKGLFDALDGVALAAARLAASRSPIELKVTVAGEFMNPNDREEFRERINRPDLRTAAGASRVHHAGFVSGEEKQRVFVDADCFCFPTYYYAESFGLVVVEAMSFGLPVITSRWRSVPELFPRDYDGLVEPQRPDQVAAAILRFIETRSGKIVRQIFVDNFRLDRHLERLAEAIQSLQNTHEPCGSAVQAPLHTG